MLMSFKVYGKVQGVMFRQTFIRGLLKRKLSGGATNLKDDKKTVDITIEAVTESEILSLIKKLLSLRVINSWGATVQKIQKIDPRHFELDFYFLLLIGRQRLAQLSLLAMSGVKFSVACLCYYR